MESIDLRHLDLTIEEPRVIINFIAQKRGISTKKLLSTKKPNLKRKNNEILTTKTQQNMVKIQHELRKSQHELRKSQHELRKSQHELRKSQHELRKPQQNSFNLGKHKNTQNLTYEKPSKLAKRKNTQNLTDEKPSKLLKHKKILKI